MDTSAYKLKPKGMKSIQATKTHFGRDLFLRSQEIEQCFFQTIYIYIYVYVLGSGCTASIPLLLSEPVADYFCNRQLWIAFNEVVLLYAIICACFETLGRSPIWCVAFQSRERTFTDICHDARHIVHPTRSLFLSIHILDNSLGCLKSRTPQQDQQTRFGRVPRPPSILENPLVNTSMLINMSRSHEGRGWHTHLRSQDFTWKPWKAKYLRPWPYSWQLLWWRPQIHCIFKTSLNKPHTTSVETKWRWRKALFQGCISRQTFNPKSPVWQAAGLEKLGSRRQRQAHKVSCGRKPLGFQPAKFSTKEYEWKSMRLLSIDLGLSTEERPWAKEIWIFLNVPQEITLCDTCEPPILWRPPQSCQLCRTPDCAKQFLFCI